MPNNVIDATDEPWTSILKKNKLAGAYYYVGESTFNQLAIMFGPKVLKQEQDKEVIVVSDTTVLVVATEPIDSEGRADTVETVISPVWAKEPKVRWKLFDEDQNNGDHELSTEGTEYYYAMAPDENVEKRQSPPRPREVCGRPPIPNASPAASSCASSSPIGWWGKLNK
ncbi:hypothetical protein AAHA92_07353 [Salvia divinorum]|uniref:Uncharacterized protein n=1 Tax=Salvia divinorum TaxID=28513 RepID=A0ABD1ICP7_SALDI